MESSRRRVLVVANRTAATPDLMDAVKRYAREQPTTFSLLIPDAGKAEHADWTLELALPLLQRAARGPWPGSPATPTILSRRSVTSLARAHYDLIIISTLPKRVSAMAAPGPAAPRRGARDTGRGHHA